MLACVIASYLFAMQYDDANVQHTGTHNNSMMM